jgi:4'-phosphopantetheinyl transferase EntD
VLAQILPPQASAAEAYSDLLDASLFPEEQAALARAVEKRRHEFTTGRACARAALAKLGIAPVPITRGPDGAPQWPPGIVGSITHCAGYRAAAVAWATDILTIGLDAEPAQPLAEDVLGAVSSADECAQVTKLASAWPGVCWDCLLFSAKESVFKAWFPLTQRWLDFRDVAVTLSPSDGSFTARLLVPGPVLDGDELTGFTGRWLTRKGLLLTAVALFVPVGAADAAG